MFNNPIRYNDPLGDCPPGEDCQDNYFVKVGKMMAEDLSNDIKAVKAAVSEWAKNVPILGDLTGDGEKVKGNRLHLTTEDGGASSVKTETTGEAPEVKADLLLAAMGAADPSIPEPGPLNFAEAMSKLSDAIEASTIRSNLKDNANPSFNRRMEVAPNKYAPDTVHGISKSRARELKYKDTVELESVKVAWQSLIK